MEGAQVEYFMTCPWCGAHLDPGEQCDCPEAMEAYQPHKRRMRWLGGYDYQMTEVRHEPDYA
jgi:hypothetical protein